MLASLGCVPVEGDSEAVVRWLGGEQGCLLPAVHQARRSIARLEAVSFSAVPRSCNSLADAVAKLARTFASSFLWSAARLPPTDVGASLGLANFANPTDYSAPN